MSFLQMPSFSENRTKVLEDQVIRLTKDCYYLISLLNSSNSNYWESWPEGNEIRKHLEKSKELFSSSFEEQKKKKDNEKKNIQHRIFKLEEERLRNWKKKNRI